VVLESIFRLAGHSGGRSRAIIQRDYPLVQAGVLVLGVIVVFMTCWST